MTAYCDLGIPARSLILLAFFLSVCGGGYLFYMTAQRRAALSGVPVLLSVVVSAVLMIIYTAQARSDLRSLALPPASAWLCGQSVFLPVSWLTLVSAYFGYLSAKEWKFRKNTITRSSIKEGVDEISSGLCFYAPGGRVIMANSRMNELSYQIAGSDLQDAETFWKTLSGGEVRSGVQRLSYGSYPNFRLTDGSVWTFTREKLDGFMQLTAADTTLLQSLTDELREKNLDLAAMNLRLRRYGENVDELTRTKERLETKVRIHGELGQALLATRRYLANGDGQEPPLGVWRRNIAMLRKEIAARKEGDPLQILRKAAHSAGITLIIQGELTEKAEYRQFFLAAASEAMANAVFHANAKNLRIELSDGEDGWAVRFTNDGARPEKPITEGGGLSSLRRKAEYIGVSMTVESEKEFVLTFRGRKG